MRLKIVGQLSKTRFRVMYQDADIHGFPATFAPLPAFQPVYTLNRAFNVQPDAIDRWALPSLEARVPRERLRHRIVHELFLSAHSRPRGFDLRHGQHSHQSHGVLPGDDAAQSTVPLGWRALSQSGHRGAASDLGSDLQLQRHRGRFLLAHALFILHSPIPMPRACPPPRSAAPSGHGPTISSGPKITRVPRTTRPSSASFTTNSWINSH